MTSRITTETVREWFGDVDGGDAMYTAMRDHVDPNVEWTASGPADGPLGKTCHLMGVHRGVLEYRQNFIMPLEDRFTERAKFQVGETLRNFTSSL